MSLFLPFQSSVFSRELRSLRHPPPRRGVTLTPRVQSFEGNRLNHPKMKQDLFKYIPSEIVIDIFSRLPVRSIISCKCVQKSWLHLVETQEFAKSHLSKSALGLAMHGSGLQYGSNSYKLFEFEDGFDVKNHDLHYTPVTKFNLANVGKIMGSVDGFLFLRKLSGSNPKPDTLYVLNPVTREYINIPCPEQFRDSYRQAVTYGFGSSKVTGQYKVVRIFHDYIFNQATRKWRKSSKPKCYVYTLGTGSWRRHSSCASLEYIGISSGAFVNGNLHWLVCEGRQFLRISCLDLETEHFSTFSTPFPWNGEYKKLAALSLFVLGDCLGLCDNTSGDKIVIWMMKEYGVEKSWTKEFVIGNALHHDGFYSIAYPIKVFKDGDILLQWNEIFIYYSSKTETTQKVDMLELPHGYHVNSILHTPSFLSLQSFGLDVSSF